MAKQTGIMPIQGTIGNLTFLKTVDGDQVRQKSSLDDQRIKNDPSFERTRENMSEFSKAAKGARLIRTSIRALLKNNSDIRVVGRLVKTMMKVIKSDTSSPRGFRSLENGKLDLLRGFEFNGKASLSTLLTVPFSETIDRVRGELTVTVPSLIPANVIQAPESATHFRIVSAGMEINFEKDSFMATTAYSAEIPVNRVATAPITLQAIVTPNSVHPLMQVVGIEFLQVTNGFSYPIRNRAFYALSLVGLNVV